MIDCPQCQAALTDVGTQRKKCPHCGADVPITVGHPTQLDSPATSAQGERPTMIGGASEESVPDASLEGDDSSTGVHGETVQLNSADLETRDLSQLEPAVASSSMQSGDSESKRNKTVADRNDVTAEFSVDFNKNTLGMTTDLSQSSLSAIQQTWAGAIGDANPSMTIKTQVEPSDRSGSSLVIQQRALSTVDKRDTSREADYDLIDLLGEGGMGVVFNARQASIDRSVAVKMLKPQTEAKLGREEKFLAEAVVTGELDHPNIVPIYDLGRNADGALFYSMKKVHGEAWIDVLAKQSLAQNLDVLLKVADAVAFAHSRGVVHRDLKPENVMLGDFGEVLVLDWGLALATDDCQKAPTLNASTGMGGTPSYMAPEMVQGPMEEIGPHSDVYLLGAILFECITGVPPHTGKNAMACIVSAGRNEIVPAEQSGELMDIAYKAMATVPQERYPSVQAFQSAIRDYQSHSESIALSERATEELEEAVQQDEYKDYARALYLFEEAYELWEHNNQARKGISKAKYAYANAALRKGDFDLGLSVVEPQDPAHEKLSRQLAEAQQERSSRQKRLRTLKQLVVTLAVMVFTAVTVGMLLFLQQKQRAEKNAVVAEQNANEAKTQRDIADQKRGEADEQRAIAVEKEQEAIELRGVAERNAHDARISAAEADEQRVLAEQNAKAAQYEDYIASINLAKTRIEENALDEARKILNRLMTSPDFRPYSTSWELQRLRYLVHLSQRLDTSDEFLEVVALSPDGRRMAIGGQSGSVRVMDPMSGEVIQEQEFLGVSVLALAFSRDGLLAIGTNDRSGYIKLWDLENGSGVENLEVIKNDALIAHKGKVVDLEFSRDGSLLLSASHDHTARIWDLRNPSDIGVAVLQGHAWSVCSATFSPDPEQAQIVTASQDGTVRVWNRSASSRLEFRQLREGGKANSPVRPFRGHRGPVYAAVFSPDGEHVVSAGADNRILYWQPADLRAFDYRGLAKESQGQQEDLRDRQESQANEPTYIAFDGHKAAVRSLAFSSDGRFILSASDDNSIKVWAAKSQNVGRRLPVGGLVKTLRGHSGAVTDLVTGKSLGNRLLSVSHDGDTRQWDVLSYAESRQLVGHTDAVLSAKYSPRGDRLVTASRDRTARIWDAVDGRLLRPLKEGHSYLATRVVYIPHSDRLLTAACDGTVRVWNHQTGVEEFKIEGAGSSAAVSVSSDGNWILTGRSPQSEEDTNAATGQRAVDKTRFASLWDAQTGLWIRSFGEHRKPVTVVRFSPDNRVCLTADANGRANLWETSTGRQLATLRWHTGRITSAAFTADGQQLMTASEDKTVAVWPLDEIGESAVGRPKPLLAQTLRHPAAVYSLSLTNDGHVLTGCADGQVRFWTRDGTREPSIDWKWELPRNGEGAVAANSVDVDPQQARALVVAQPLAVDSNADEGDAVYLLDLSSGYPIPATGGSPLNLLAMATGDAAVWSAIFTPDGDGFVTAGGDDARVFSLLGEEQARFGPHHTVHDASFSPDGKWVVTAGGDGCARIWDAETGRTQRKLGQHSAESLGKRFGAIRSAVFSADGEHILTGSDDGILRVWDVRTGRVVQEFVRDQAKVASASYSPDQRRIVATYHDGQAAIWSVEEPEQEPLRLEGHAGAVIDAAFSPDGARIVTGGEDFTIRVWDAFTGEALERLPSQTAPVTSVCFSSSGNRIVTACGDRKLKVWDAATFREILVLDGHIRGVNSVDFSMDGKNLVSGSADGTAIIWIATDSAELIEATADTR